MEKKPVRIYTHTGDQGETGLLGGPRVAKDAARVEVCGALDELNSAIGLARCEPLGAEIDQLLEEVQHELFSVGAEVAASETAAARFRTIEPRHVDRLERAIDRFDATLAPLGGFILPAGVRGACALHVARTICRRAERRLVALARHSDEELSPALKAYLNRLSDLLFVLARRANAAAGAREIPWRKEPRGESDDD